MTGTDRWSDLRTRILSAAILSCLGLVAIWLGGMAFVLLVALVCGLIVWEAATLHEAKSPIALGLTSGAVLMACTNLPMMFVVPLILAMALVAGGQAKAHRARFFAIVCWVLVGSFAMLLMRIGVGMGWIVWLILVVIATDVAGYFVGRRIGGPKFWPAVSPKKTWSGTIAGWIAAAAVGAAFIQQLNWDWTLVPISMAISFAGQMGDIAESALKRRLSVKDSSNLIPGHGGVFDRFDAMLGASAAALAFKALGLLPGLTA